MGQPSLGMPKSICRGPCASHARFQWACMSSDGRPAHEHLSGHAPPPAPISEAPTKGQEGLGLKRGTTNHPKTLALAAELGVDRCVAVGILEGLFHFASQYARRGDVGRYPDGAIASGCGTSLDGGAVVKALLASRWLDTCGCHRLRVHDWPEHADQGVQRSPEVKRDGFLACYAQLEDSSEMLVTDSQIGRPSGGRQTEDGGRRKAEGTGRTEDGGRPRVGIVDGNGRPVRVGPAPDSIRAEVKGLLTEVSLQQSIPQDVIQAQASRTPSGRVIVNVDNVESIPWLTAMRDRLIGMKLTHAADQQPAKPSEKAKARWEAVKAGVMGGLREHEREELARGLYEAPGGLSGPGYDARAVLGPKPRLPGES